MSIDQNIYTNLRDRLLNGEFDPGQRLRSEQLKQDYQVSASTIREILLRLSVVGLVDLLEQRGFRVPQQSIELQNDLTQTRIMLECEGACLSIKHGGVGWEARLTAAHHELKYIETQVRTAEITDDLLALWTNAEFKFHRTLIDECQSEVLKEIHLQVYHRFRQQLITCDKEFAFVPENIAQHEAILDAVLQRDEDLVRQRIHMHLARNLVEPLSEDQVVVPHLFSSQTPFA